MLKTFTLTLILSLGSASASAAELCSDVFRPLLNPPTANLILHNETLAKTFEHQLRQSQLWTDRATFVGELQNLKNQDRLIVRGVAPFEALQSFSQNPAQGRRKLRAVYGIKKTDVRPGFLIDSSISKTTLETIMFDLDRYASQGATLEAYAAKYNNNEPLPAVSVKFNRIHQAWNLEGIADTASGRWGYWVVYKVPPGLELTHHPESKVRLPEHVVDIPAGLEIVAILPAQEPAKLSTLRLETEPKE